MTRDEILKKIADKRIEAEQATAAKQEWEDYLITHECPAKIGDIVTASLYTGKKMKVDQIEVWYEWCNPSRWLGFLVYGAVMKNDNSAGKQRGKTVYFWDAQTRAYINKSSRYSV